MALKSNFEATSVLSSPFVDEIANSDHRRRRTTEAEVVTAVKKSGLKFVGSKGRKAISRARASEAAGLAELQERERKRKTPFRK